MVDRFVVYRRQNRAMKWKKTRKWRKVKEKLSKGGFKEELCAEKWFIVDKIVQRKEKGHENGAK